MSLLQMSERGGLVIEPVCVLKKRHAVWNAYWSLRQRGPLPAYTHIRECKPQELDSYLTVIKDLAVNLSNYG